MTDNPETPPPATKPQGTEAARGTDMLLVTYICYLISIVFGITAILGVVIAYLQRGEVSGTWRESHYTWLIRTFWMGILFMAVSITLMVVGIGVLLAFATLVWFIIRLVKGWMRYSKEQPVENVESWLIG